MGRPASLGISGKALRGGRPDADPRAWRAEIGTDGIVCLLPRCEEVPAPDVDASGNAADWTCLRDAAPLWSQARSLVMVVGRGCA